jgi:hypothetical protein
MTNGQDPNRCGLPALMTDQPGPDGRSPEVQHLWPGTMPHARSQADIPFLLFTAPLDLSLLRPLTSPAPLTFASLGPQAGSQRQRQFRSGDPNGLE